MAISRYTRTNRLNGGMMFATSETHVAIREAILLGKISYTTRILREGERLDTLAGSLYGDSKYWWILAAASGIGWGLQVPPGTLINVPDLNSTIKYVR